MIGERARYHILAWGTVTAYVAGYVAINHLATPDPAQAARLDGDLDAAIPLVPAFVIPYFSMFLLTILPVFMLPDYEHLRMAAVAYWFSMIVGFTIFVLFPVTFPRQDMIGRTGPCAALLELLYAIDRPLNCFPSLHVTLAFLGAWFTAQIRPRWRAALIAWSALIAASILFTRQHSLADLAGGAALTALSVATTRRLTMFAPRNDPPAAGPGPL